MSESLLQVDVRDEAIVVVTLNRPHKRNALSMELIEQISAAVSGHNAHPSRRAIIFAGNGPAFCAGLDLGEASQPGHAEKSAEALARMYEAIGNSPLITIAAAHGAAMGGGAGILAACDFIVAGDDLRLAYPEVRRGLVAALVTCLLRRRASDGVVRELILLGNNIAANKAKEMGLVTEIVSHSRLIEEAMQLAQEACGGAPGAIARSKKLLDAMAPRSLHDDLAMALEFHLTARNSEEAAEGIAAFKEKREPKWKRE